MASVKTRTVKDERPKTRATRDETVKNDTQPGVVTKTKQVAQKAGSAVKAEAKSLFDFNTAAGKEGVKRASVQKSRELFLSLIRARLGGEYTELVQGSELAGALESIATCNLLKIASSHLEGRVPGAAMLGVVSEEALNQTYQEKFHLLAGFMEEIVTEAVGQLKESGLTLPWQGMKEEEKAVEEEVVETIQE